MYLTTCGPNTSLFTPIPLVQHRLNWWVVESRKWGTCKEPVYIFFWFNVFIRQDSAFDVHWWTLPSMSWGGGAHNHQGGGGGLPL